ncbi:hypothetical protein [Methylobacter svalbardensis]|uniref:hypothetical protein n=1 Tax=Methylobacter svalbardensis TaxID=3080016 RepID=UPI0030EB4FA5
MKTDDPFNKQFKILANKYKNMPHLISDEMLESCCVINDALDVAWATAQSVFEDQAKPDHALKILEIFFDHAERIKTERQKYIETGD